MIRYGYNRQVSPPAPFVHVTLRCAETGKEIADVPAQLDCAADCTVIPRSLVEDLGLAPLDELRIGGFAGQVFLVTSYRIEISIRSLKALMVEVIAHAEEPFVLLGRDVLNTHRILLDGPGLALEVE
jgi:predicted aspartyl protease